jgi:hypothetical protein
VRAGFGWASLGLAGLGVASLGVALVFPPAAAAAPWLFGAAGLAGVGAGTASIASRLSRDRVDAAGVAMDIAGIAASLLTLGAGALGALRAVAGGSTRLLTAQRMLSLGALGAEGLENVFVGAEYAGALADTLTADASIEERRRRTVLLLAQMLATAGLMVVSTRQAYGSLDALGRTSPRLAIEPDWWARELSSAERNHLHRTARLGTLDDDALAMDRRIRDRRPHAASAEPGYDVEVDLGNGHVWRRRERDGLWCRFSRKFCEPTPPPIAPSASFPPDVSVPSPSETVAFRQSPAARVRDVERGAPSSWTGDMEARYRGWPPAGDGYRWELTVDGEMRIRRINELDVQRRVATFDESGALTGFVDGHGFIEARLTGIQGVADSWEVSGAGRREALDEIESRRTAARQRKERARTEAGRARAHDELVRASEELGEVAGDAWVRAHLAQIVGMPRGAFTLSQAFDGTGSGVFDRVYRVVPRDGSPPIYIVLEAKGAGGRLGVRNTPLGLAQQGTRAYFNSIVESMNRGDTAALAQELRSSATRGRVRYVMTASRVSGGVPSTVGRRFVWQ